MPYIKKERRGELERYSYDGGNPLAPMTAGELNYMITALINEYRVVHHDNYQTINDIIGAVEGAKMEFYRRVVVPYEDSKIKENGDVY